MLPQSQPAITAADATTSINATNRFMINSLSEKRYLTIPHQWRRAKNSIKIVEREPSVPITSPHSLKISRRVQIFKNRCVVYFDECGAL